MLDVALVSAQRAGCAFTEAKTGYSRVLRQLLLLAESKQSGVFARHLYAGQLRHLEMHAAGGVARHLQLFVRRRIVAVVLCVSVEVVFRIFEQLLHAARGSRRG